jgi:hypothetical protein
VVLAASVVRGGPVNVAQALAIPTFMVTVAAVWLLARTGAARTGALTRRLLLTKVLPLLLGFLLGCIIAAAAVSLVADWAWSLPAGLAGLAAALQWPADCEQSWSV